MAFLRVQHIGICVHDLQDACDRFQRIFGLVARDFRDDQGKGMQLDARILLGNDCWNRTMDELIVLTAYQHSRLAGHGGVHCMAA